MCKGVSVDACFDHSGTVLVTVMNQPSTTAAVATQLVTVLARSPLAKRMKWFQNDRIACLRFDSPLDKDDVGLLRQIFQGLPAILAGELIVHPVAANDFADMFWPDHGDVMDRPRYQRHLQLV